MLLINDPREIPQEDGPLFISKDGTFDLISYLIKVRTQAEWNHSMLSRTKGKFVSQDLLLNEKSMDLYMRNGTRLDFFTLVDINTRAIDAMNTYVNKRLSGAWYTKGYDFLGIIGQLIGIPAIHTPGLDYCSVFTLEVLRQMAPFLSDTSARVIMSMTRQSQPQQLHDMKINHPEVFNHYGMYESDAGVVLS